MVRDHNNDLNDITVQKSPFDLISFMFRLGMYWEKPMQSKFDQFLAATNPDGIVLDIGANIGSHTIYLGKYRSVWAFEPQKTTFDILETNVSNNSLSHKVKCFNFALSDRTGKSSMVSYNPLNVGQMGIGEGGETIHTRCLDDVWIEHGSPKIAFVKIDVEGHELQVFGGGKLCLSNVPIFFEDHSGENGKYLKNLGYTIKEHKFWLSDNDYIAIPDSMNGSGLLD
jgi:FkbM family methyltransferase